MEDTMPLEIEVLGFTPDTYEEEELQAKLEALWWREEAHEKAERLALCASDW